MLSTEVKLKFVSLFSVSKHLPNIRQYVEGCQSVDGIRHADGCIGQDGCGCWTGLFIQHKIGFVCVNQID
jgi:hypothetical protein